jgi:hypothetical protein
MKKQRRNQGKMDTRGQATSRRPYATIVVRIADPMNFPEEMRRRSSLTNATTLVAQSMNCTEGVRNFATTRCLSSNDRRFVIRSSFLAISFLIFGATI